jgi:hypothetical protein
MLLFIYFVLPNVHFHVLENILLGVITPHSCTDTFPGKEGEIQVLGGLAPSSQKVVSLVGTPGQQNWPE